MRFSDTDMLGHVNNASYFTYMEETRLSFLEELGLDVRNDVFTIMLASAKCDFIRQGYFGQILKVNTTVQRIGRTSFTLSSEFLDKETESVIAKGEATVVYVDIANQIAAELPESIRAQLQEHLQTT